MSTCLDTCRNYSYMMTNLIGEVGELASKIAKAIRKERFTVNDNQLEAYADSFPEEMWNYDFIREEADILDHDLMREAGDVLWQLSGLCAVMGWSLEDVAKENLAKLASRKKRGVIDGNGDNR